MLITPPPRWVRRNTIIYPSSTCHLCGVSYGERRRDGACPVTECLACETPQCLYNGLGRRQCSLCLYGLLGGYRTQDCGYAGCRNRAIMAAPRVWYACRDHAKKKGLFTRINRELHDNRHLWHIMPGEERQ